MTDTAKRILPSNSTPFERSHVDNLIASQALIDVDAVEVQGDPEFADAVHLPDLAYDKGSSLWDDAWSDTQKRNYIRDLWTYKLLEGTPLGVEAYLNLAGARLVREVLPPAETFAMPDLGEVTHEQLLALMPQLRLYYHWPDKDFPETVAFGDFACADRMFAYPDQGEALGRYPVLFDPATGVETPLDVVSYDEVSDEVVLSHRGTAGTGFFVDYACADVAVAGTALVPDPIVYKTQDPDMQTLRTSPPLPCWELAADVSLAGYSFAMPDVGDVGTYDRLTLWDASRIPNGHLSVATAGFFADWSWLGMPAYQQILTVAVPGTPAQLPYAALTADVGFALGDEQTSLFKAVQAVATAKRGGDRILLDLAPTFAGTRPATLPAITDISR